MKKLGFITLTLSLAMAFSHAAVDKTSSNTSEIEKNLKSDKTQTPKSDIKSPPPLAAEKKAQTAQDASKDSEKKDEDRQLTPEELDKMKEQLADFLKSQNFDPETIAKFEQYLDSLPDHSTGMCARGVRRGLEALGMKIDPKASAKQYGDNLTDPGYYTPTNDLNPQNFDVRIMDSNNGHGHAELYYEGKWYSDFKQSKSLYASRSYSDYQSYRLINTPRDLAKVVGV